MDVVMGQQIAIRLADEGVPLRAIARATEIPSTRLYETLVEAKLDGRLFSLPRDDWPPGCPRDQRALQLSRLAAEHHDTLLLTIKRVFALPTCAARLLILLLQYEHVPHARVDMDHKALMVHICRMRKALRPYGLRIETLWGYGYSLPLEHRRRAMEMVLPQVTNQLAVV
jgi:hypothetical protein